VVVEKRRGEGKRGRGRGLFQLCLDEINCALGHVVTNKVSGGSCFCTFVSQLGLQGNGGGEKNGA